MAIKNEWPRRLLAIISVVAVIGLRYWVDNHNQRKEFQTETRGNDAVTVLSRSNEEMQSIVDEARRTVPIFLKALRNPAKDESGFSVKYAFNTDEGSPFLSENIWLSKISENNGKFKALVANDPFYIKGLKYGDAVEFDMTKIKDWKYIKDNKVVGGKSIKYLIENIPESERSNEEKEYLKMFP